MLHSRRTVQDENRTASIRSKSVNDTENAGVPWKQSGKGAPRRALGNITNVALRNDSLAGSKTPGTLLPSKIRALGKITNLPPSAKPAAPKQSTKDKPAAPVAAAKSELDLLAEQYAKDGTESLAGKGWQQLQAEAEEREDQAIAARIRAIASIPYRSSLGHLLQVLQYSRLPAPIAGLQTLPYDWLSKLL